jgi:L-iditol 2-dehydrogenase
MTVSKEMPVTMQVSVLRGVRDVAIEERPVPDVGPGEVLVKVCSVGVCGSDVHYYEHGRIGDFVVTSPLILGHEAGGVIVAVGKGVPEHRVGERVAIEPGVPCRRCDQCRHGRYNLCPDISFFATPPVDGAFAEYVAMPADFVFPVPDSLSDDAAGLIEPLSVGVWANRKAGTTAGTTLLVSGAGPIGLLVAAVARAEGAAEIVVSDIDPQRLELARAYGATRVADARDTEALDGIEVDAFVDCSGAAPAVAGGIRALRGDGTAVLVGMGADEMVLPVSLIQNKEIRLTGTFRYANTWPAAIALAASGAVDLDGMVTGRVGLDRAEEALCPDPDAQHVKIVVRPGDV